MFDDREAGEAEPRDHRGEEGLVAISAMVDCPVCGAANEIAIDPGGGAVQEYVQDCEVCCNPWELRVDYLPDGSATASAEPI